MSFSIKSTIGRPYVVVYESDDVVFGVGQISRDSRREWLFHFEAEAQYLKPPVYEELKVYGRQQAELMAVTMRLTA